MAEPPSTATRLLEAAAYDAFAAYVTGQGWARGAEAAIAEQARRVHAELLRRRHPPGPTPAYLTLMRLVEGGWVDVAVLNAA